MSADLKALIAECPQFTSAKRSGAVVSRDGDVKCRRQFARIKHFSDPEVKRIAVVPACRYNTGRRTSGLGNYDVRRNRDASGCGDHIQPLSRFNRATVCDRNRRTEASANGFFLTARFVTKS